jgi:hypothetical protein
MEMNTMAVAAPEERLNCVRPDAGPIAGVAGGPSPGARRLLACCVAMPRPLCGERGRVPQRCSYYRRWTSRGKGPREKTTGLAHLRASVMQVPLMLFMPTIARHDIELHEGCCVSSHTYYLRLKCLKLLVLLSATYAFQQK